MAAEALVFIGIGLFILLIMACAVSSMVLWIWMIIDCAQRKFKEDNEKVVWILLLVFLGVIGAIVYYFVVKRKK